MNKSQSLATLTEYPLHTRQACFFIIAFTPIIKLFVLPSVLAGASGHDMWLSCLIALLIDFLTLALIVTLTKNANADFFTLLESFFGKVGSKIILSLYAAYFLLKSVLPVYEQKEYIELTLYITRPNAIVFIVFFVGAVYLATKKLRVLGRTADVFFGMTAVGLIAVSIMSLGNFDGGAIFPIASTGVKSILAGAYRGAPWFGDSVYFTFFIGNIKKTKRSGLKILLSYAGTAAFVLFFMLLFYSAFGAIAPRQRYNLTEIAKYTAVVNNIGRVDYFATFMILSSGVISAAVPLFFAAKLLKHAIGEKSNYICAFAAVIPVFILVFFLSRYVPSYERFMTEIMPPVLLIFGNLFPIAFSLIVKFKGEIYAQAKQL